MPPLLQIFCPLYISYYFIQRLILIEKDLLVVYNVYGYFKQKYALIITEIFDYSLKNPSPTHRSSSSSVVLVGGR